MIIIGYPGVGKSTLAGRYKEYIDLESSNWNGPDNTKPDNWWWSYGKVAEDLSRQGYRVFVSCHPSVQKYFEESNEYVISDSFLLRLRAMLISLSRSLVYSTPTGFHK